MNMPKVPLENDDRVLVVKDGKIAKGRVAEVLGSNAARVTFAKGDEGTIYERSEITAAYRYIAGMVMTEIGPQPQMGIFPLIAVETDNKTA